MRALLLSIPVYDVPEKVLAGEASAGLLVHDRGTKDIKTFDILTDWFELHGKRHRRYGYCQVPIAIDIDTKTFDWYLFTGVDEHTVIDPNMPLYSHNMDKEALNSDGYLLLSDLTLLVNGDILGEPAENEITRFYKLNCLARGHYVWEKPKLPIGDATVERSIRLE